MKFCGNWEIHEPRDAAHFVIRRRSSGAQRSSGPVSFQEQLEELAGVMKSLKSWANCDGDGQVYMTCSSDERKKFEAEGDGGQGQNQHETADDQPQGPKLETEAGRPRSHDSVPVRRIRAKPLSDSSKMGSALGALLRGAWSQRSIPSLLLVVIGTSLVVTMVPFGFGLLTFLLLAGLELACQYRRWKRAFAPSLEYWLCEDMAAQLSENSKIRSDDSTYGARNTVVTKTKDGQHFKWSHYLLLSEAAKRGLNTVGMPFLAYLTIRYTVGLEYALNIYWPNFRTILFSDVSVYLFIYFFFFFLFVCLYVSTKAFEPDITEPCPLHHRPLVAPSWD